MKKITLQKGLTFALLLLAGVMCGQTAVNNTIRLTSSSGGSSDAIVSEVNNVTIDAAGLVTGNLKFVSNITAASGNRTGTVTLGEARGKSIPMTFNTAFVIDQTLGVNYGAIITPGGIQRAAAGDIGVGVATPLTTPANPSNPSTGVDIGEGVTFGFDLTGFPTTVKLQITKITYSVFTGGTGEGATIVNRQDTSKSIAFTGNTTVKDVTALGMFLTGGTGYTEMLSTFNTSPTTTNNWRVKEIEFKLINTSSTWNGTAWSNGTPTIDTDTFIEGTYSALATGSFTCKSLTVNSGSITIESTKAVRVADGAIINNVGPAGVVLESGGYIRQDLATAVNIGTSTVKRNSNSLLRLDYSMWSSPVSGTQTLADFSPLTSQAPNRFYTYDSATDLYANVAPTTILDASNAGKGYLIRMPNDASAVTPTAYAGVFTGVINNGPITLGGLTAGKFYSVGNPYPSSINAFGTGANSFFDLNPGIGGTLYFWRKTNGVVNGAPGNGSAYATRTSAGGTASGNLAPNDIVPTAEIAVGQGFIVNTGTATAITFNTAMRNTVASNPFLKTKAAATPDRVWLNLTNATGAFSQALIAYMDTATLGFDNGIDGEYINDSSLALTSNINNKEYTIQGRPTFDASDVVALNFKTDLAGEYTIALDHFDGVFTTGQAVYLVDSKTGSETDLKAGGYNFTAAVGSDNARFSLKYQKTLKVIDSEFSDNSITVYGNNGSLFVKSAVSAIQNIKVFDIQGRLIAEQKNVKSNTAAVANLKTNQALIVQVSTEDNKVVSKKVLN
jgi:hypothetical protein